MWQPREITCRKWKNQSGQLALGSRSNILIRFMVSQLWHLGVLYFADRQAAPLYTHRLNCCIGHSHSPANHITTIIGPLQSLGRGLQLRQGVVFHSLDKQLTGLWQPAHLTLPALQWMAATFRSSFLNHSSRSSQNGLISSNLGGLWSSNGNVATRRWNLEVS